MSNKKIALYLAALLVGSGAIAASAQEKPLQRSVSEKFIVHITERIRDLAFSQDGRRVAYIAQAADKKELAVIDGKKEQAYNEIAEMAFSPDSQRVAYMASEGGKWFIVIDGQEQKRYDGIGENTLVFSPDSKRVAYQAALDEKRFVVVDGKEENAYDGILPPPIFSPDSKHLFYLAFSKFLLKVSLLIDGLEQKPYDLALKPDFENTLTFSVDGRRFAYAAIKGKEILVVVDGQEQKLCVGCDALGPPWASDKNTRKTQKLKDMLIFSPDNRLAYVAYRGNRQVVVVNGKEEKEWGATFGALVFSPDGKHLAYEAAEKPKGKRFIVLDGQVQRPYTGTRRGSLVFSPDGSRLAYAAYDRKTCTVVVDGIEGPKYHSSGGVIFAPDSKRIAYKVENNNRLFVVVDGKESKRYDWVGFPVFAPDSKRVAYVAKEDHKFFVVIDGHEGKRYDYAFTISFDGPNRLHYLAANKGPNGSDFYYLVEEKLD